MSQGRPPQKLVSFTTNKADLEKIEAELKDGWRIISLVVNDGCYVGVMEKLPNLPTSSNEDVEVFIPARRKIKISY